MFILGSLSKRSDLTNQLPAPGQLPLDFRRVTTRSAAHKGTVDPGSAFSVGGTAIKLNGVRSVVPQARQRINCAPAMCFEGSGKLSAQYFDRTLNNLSALAGGGTLPERISLAVTDLP